MQDFMYSLTSPWSIVGVIALVLVIWLLIFLIIAVLNPMQAKAVLSGEKRRKEIEAIKTHNLSPSYINVDAESFGSGAEYTGSLSDIEVGVPEKHIESVPMDANSIREALGISGDSTQIDDLETEDTSSETGEAVSVNQTPASDTVEQPSKDTNELSSNEGISLEETDNLSNTESHISDSDSTLIPEIPEVSYNSESAQVKVTDEVETPTLPDMVDTEEDNLQTSTDITPDYEEQTEADSGENNTVSKTEQTQVDNSSFDNLILIGAYSGLLDGNVEKILQEVSR
jgi:hypothetical protein